MRFASVCFGLIVLLHTGFAAKEKPAAKDKLPEGWLSDYAAAKKAAKDSGKPILAVFH
jgi:hypothetical protein